MNQSLLERERVKRKGFKANRRARIVFIHLALMSILSKSADPNLRETSWSSRSPKTRRRFDAATRPMHISATRRSSLAAFPNRECDDFVAPENLPDC